MSTKINTSQLARDKLLEKLSQAKLETPPLRRANMLTREDRMGRNNWQPTNFKPIGLMMTSMQPAITIGGSGQKAMRSALEVVEDLKNRYIDLSEYKRYYVPVKSAGKDLDQFVHTELNLSKSNEIMIDRSESLTVDTPSKFYNGQEEIYSIMSPSTQTDTPVVTKPSSRNHPRLSMVSKRDNTPQKQT